MRSRMIIMVALLAVAGVMAAMAYTSATVNNDAKVSIVNTSGALLALSCNTGTGHMDATCSTDSGRLALNFDAGNGADYGLQPGSTYVFGNVFRVTNNSKDSIQVTITGPSVSGAKAGTGYTVAAADTNFTLPAGDYRDISVTGTVANDESLSGPHETTFTVQAVAN